MNWWDQIDEGRRRPCAEIRRALSLRFRPLFGYGEKPSQETLDKAREDMIAAAIKAGADEDEATIIVDSIMERR